MKIFQILLVPLILRLTNGLSYSTESNPVGYSDYFKSNELNSGYSNSIGYSDYFNSNCFNFGSGSGIMGCSDCFNSNKVSSRSNSIHYSNYFNSFLFSQPKQTWSNYLTQSHVHNSHNNILTQVVSTWPKISTSTILSYDSGISIREISISGPTTNFPTLSPTILQTQPPTIKNEPVQTFKPTQTHTVKPSAVPTISPTKSNQIVPIMSFESDIVFNNLEKAELDDLSKNLIIINCANIMNISKTYLRILQPDTKIKTPMSFAHLLGFNLLVKLQTAIPLSNEFSKYKTEPNTIYSLLTNKLAQSVSSGNFINQLQLLSSSQNISTFVNSSVLSITNGKYLVENSAEKSHQNPNIKSVVNVIIITLVFAFVFLLGHWIKVHGIPKFNKNQGLRIDLDVINNPMGII